MTCHLHCLKIVMNFWKRLLFSAGSVGLLSSASALTFTDVDVDGNEGEPNWQYMATWSTPTWAKTFNLLTAGFDPETMEIISASISFAFADDNGDRSDNKFRKLEYASILVGGETLWNWIEVDGSHYNSPNSYDWYNSSLSANLVSQLQDGVIDYSVEAKYGDFYLKEASLSVQAETRSQVSDTGTTLAMLGLGVASMVILRRQMAKGRE